MNGKRCQTFGPGTGPDIPPPHEIYRLRVAAGWQLRVAADILGVAMRHLGDVEHNRIIDLELVARATVLYSNDNAPKSAQNGKPIQ